MCSHQSFLEQEWRWQLADNPEYASQCGQNQHDERDEPDRRLVELLLCALVWLDAALAHLLQRRLHPGIPLRPG